ncbi:MAG TPA: GAF and ANTAR domain-containing protein [Mycobacterium sp.]|uniref:GAF and ANTAR domain-containing protein n=1 Tax=Mycobacterium sp. TaxID=1785 RepID=UPI002B72DE33|nr:GAF and ANTAR domain-containing protein [Mycobacterium sp.]HME77809.1 GAF and ANTAR domain-containing protein [Mycobacterium sp.]
MRARFLAALVAYPDGALGPHQLCALCVESLSVDRAAIVITVGSTVWDLLSASDDVAARIEAGQATAGEGPAIEAVRRGGPVLVENLSAQLARWPGFGAAVGEHGRGAMFAFPLQIGAIGVGVLDLYRVLPTSARGDEVAAMLAVADIITMVLLSHAPPAVPAGVDANDLDAWWAPLSSSREIHQATGMIVAQLAVPPDMAYLRLQAYAFSQGRVLMDVARDVVARRVRFDPDDVDRR